jgi:SHS2 domain-containing protein
MFQIFDHTADLGLRVRGATLEELFSEAARGLFSVIVGDLDAVRPVVEQTLEIPGKDREYLLFDWLTELLYRFDSQRWLMVEFDVRFTAEGLIGVCRGEALDPSRHRLEHEVKAITYHALKVAPTPDGWLAEVIVDI